MAGMPQLTLRGRAAVPYPKGTLYVVCNNDQLTYLLPGKDALERGAWAPLRRRLHPEGCGDPDRHWEDAHLW